MSQARTRFEALDSWRGISALLVALFHLDVTSHVHDLTVVRHAWMLVDFFFVLSGFVIAHAYLDGLDSAGSAWRFALRRFGRLWPLHAAMLLPFLAIALAKLAGHHALADDQTPAGLGASLLMIHAWGLFAAPVWNVPSWSISAEWAAYGVFALFCLWVPRGARMAVAVAMAAGAIALLAALSPHLLDATAAFGVPRCLAGFFAGVALALLWRDRPGLRLGGTAAELLVLALALTLLTLPRASVWTLAAPLVFAAMVHVFAVSGGAISRALTGRLPVLLGTLSYSLYMTHYLLSQLVSSVLQHAGIARGAGSADSYPPFLVSPWLGDLITLAYLAAVIALSWFSYRLVEQPGRTFFNRLAARRSSTASQALAPSRSSL